MPGTDDNARLATLLAAEARKLWSHVPEVEQPDDDEPCELGTDEGGHLLLRFTSEEAVDVWRLVGFGQPEGLAAMKLTLRGQSVQARCWRAGEEIGEADLPFIDPRLN